MAFLPSAAQPIVRQWNISYHPRSVRLSRPHTDTCGRSNDVAVPATPRGLAVAHAGLWTLLAAQLVTVWRTSWDIRWHLLSRPRILVDTSLEEMMLLQGGEHGETQAS
jgi:hypothetical protein